MIIIIIIIIYYYGTGCFRDSFSVGKNGEE